MYQGSRRVLFPATLLAFGGVLLGLLVAAPRPPVVREAASKPTSAVLPWEPLSRPAPELISVSSLVSSGSKKKRQQQRGQLEALYEDTTISPVTRGLAAFALGMSLSGQNTGSRAAAYLRAPEIEATELGGYALHFEARELESLDPAAALDALEQLEARFPDFAQIDAARLRYARLLRAKGEREEAVRVLKRAAQSEDEKLRGEALDEVSKVLIELGRYPEAVEALERLYYELPRHPRAANGGRRLTGLRSRLPEPPATHFYELQLKRAELLMEKRRYRDAYNGLRSILQRYAKVADTDYVRLKMALCQYRRRQLTASLANFKRVKKEDLLPESLFYQSEVSRRKRQKSYPDKVAELVTRFPESRWTEEALFSLADYQASNDEPDGAYRDYDYIATHFPHGKHYVESRWKVLFELYRSGRFEEAAFGLEETARERPGADELARFLYWAGRSYQEAGRFDRAEPLFRQVLLGYQNTYYGRRVGLVESALDEATAAVKGERDDASFLAMAAWIHSDQKQNLQAIITIREAFPFHISATGDLLPRPIWELFYPMPYQEAVERLATQRGLDTYLVAALIRQ
jgi:tetratricopeptide (TPR) repeat protein